MSFITKSVWLIKGLKEYTKNGYQNAAKNFNPADMQGIRCEGRCFMITGANSGIGKVVATEVAKTGGTTHLVCRNRERGETAVNEIKQESDNALVFLHVVDLSKPVEVYNFAKQFASSGQKLDVLVNNAGCMIHDRCIDELGYDTNFATNTLAVHILTESLMPLIQQSTDPRVVNVSSGGMLTEKLNISDLQSKKMKPYDGTAAYAQQKRQQVIMTEKYAERFPTVKFSCMHPGWADTPAVQQAMPSFYTRMKDKLRSPEEGADTVSWLALSPAAQLIESGKFFQDRKPVPTHLPLSWTRSSDADCVSLMAALDEMLGKLKQ